MSKKVNGNDVFHDAKVLDAKTDDKKAIKNFIVALSQRTTNDKIFKDFIHEVKKFTHSFWATFKELVNLNISQSDGKIIYNANVTIATHSYNQTSIDFNKNIIKNILQSKFPVFQELARENETLYYILLEYWNNSKVN